MTKVLFNLKRLISIRFIFIVFPIIILVVICRRRAVNSRHHWLIGVSWRRRSRVRSQYNCIGIFDRHLHSREKARIHVPITMHGDETHNGLLVKVPYNWDERSSTDKSSRGDKNDEPEPPRTCNHPWSMNSTPGRLPYVWVIFTFIGFRTRTLLLPTQRHEYEEHEEGGATRTQQYDPSGKCQHKQQSHTNIIQMKWQLEKEPHTRVRIHEFVKCSLLYNYGDEDKRDRKVQMWTYI